MGRASRRGSVRGGEALLAGLLHCGLGGHKVLVAYSGTHSNIVRYHCRGSQINRRRAMHLVGGLRGCRISAEVIVRFQPLGVQAALSE